LVVYSKDFFFFAVVVVVVVVEALSLSFLKGISERPSLTSQY